VSKKLLVLNIDLKARKRLAYSLRVYPWIKTSSELRA